jgi:hypothetical protein
MPMLSELRQVPWNKLRQTLRQHKENRPGDRPAGGGASRGGSDHRDGGAFGALEMTGHRIGIFCRDQAELFHRLAAPPRLCGEPIAGAGRQGEHQGLWP